MDSQPVSRGEKDKRGNQSESSVDESQSQPVLRREPEETDTCEIIGPTMEVQSGITILKTILELIV